MMKKEKGFYISLLSGIVCIAVVGAICMNLFAKPEQKTENVPIAEETELVVPTPAAATAETAKKAEEKSTKEAYSKSAQKTNFILIRKPGFCGQSKEMF